MGDQPPPSYQASIFGSDDSAFQSEQKGDILESDANTYRPFYPYYQDFSINKK